ncbi:unnamed protein product, partial [Citrullus colocynthis]
LLPFSFHSSSISLSKQTLITNTQTHPFFSSFALSPSSPLSSFLSPHSQPFSNGFPLKTLISISFCFPSISPLSLHRE